MLHRPSKTDRLLELVENVYRGWTPPYPADYKCTEKKLKDAAAILKERQGRAGSVVELYYGLGPAQPNFEKEIGEIFDLSSSRIYSIRREAVAMLREILVEEWAKTKSVFVASPADFS